MSILAFGVVIYLLMVLLWALYFDRWVWGQYEASRLPNRTRLSIIRWPWTVEVAALIMALLWPIVLVRWIVRRMRK